MRSAKIDRKTAETEISLSLEIDGTGTSRIDTDCGFIEHMLTLFARHGRFDLGLVCRGDSHVDDHHSVEDIGICLGKAFAEALGDKKGILRYGSETVPMDEALIMSAVDISGRGMLCFGLEIP
ncbi:MAG: imidazoleglycerol-phosphate dehydratase, partial [Synergistes sp.]|nr:imidazoleglycerol-phosphate dehydratase [Synergistes sp.]